MTLNNRSAPLFYLLWTVFSKLGDGEAAQSGADANKHLHRDQADTRPRGRITANDLKVDRHVIDQGKECHTREDVQKQDRDD